MDIQRTLLILIAFVIIAFVQALPIKEIENPEGINDGANAFDQHNLRQLFQDSDCNGRKCSVDDDCCWEEYSFIHSLGASMMNAELVRQRAVNDLDVTTPSFWETRGGKNNINNNHRGKWERGHRKT